jgi:outer membrane protein TolC
MKIIFTYTLFIIYIATAIAQTPLSYNDFISNVRKNYPLITRANNISTIGQIKFQSARGGFDPFITSNYENKYYSSTNYYSIFEAKIKQPIYSSQYIIAGYQHTQGDFLNPQNYLPSNGLPFLGVEASLMQGLMIDKRRADVLKGAGYKDYHEAEKNAITNAVLFQASSAYFDWVFSCKELSLYNFFSAQAYQRFIAIKTLSEVGEYAIIDSIEANILFETRNLDRQSIIIENQKKASEIISLTWGDNNKSMIYTSSLQLEDSLETYYTKTKLRYYSLIQDTMNYNPILEQYQAYQTILNVDKKYKAELIKPRLDISYNFLSNNINGFENSFTTNNYKWGVNFSVPLFLRTSRNDYKISKLHASNNQLELSNKTNELNIKIEVLITNTELIIKQMVNAEKNVHYSKILLAAEKEKFTQGESSLFLLNTRETKWMEAELKLAEYKLKFIKNVLEIEYTKGEMLYEL